MTPRPKIWGSQLPQPPGLTPMFNLMKLLNSHVLCWFAEEVENDGGRVLIHCQAGVSRSSTIAIAYVMVKLSMTMLEAFHFVKSKRPIVAPNFNFMGQLLDFESTLDQGGCRRDDNHHRN